MSHEFPSPETIHPVRLPDGTAIPNNVFLKPLVDNPQFEVGEFTYASDLNPPADPKEWVSRLAPYLYPFSRDKLVIGKFCQIAHGVRFITNSANHKMDGFSTFPFAIHDPDRLMSYPGSLPRGRDTVVGNDVWIGMNVIVLPGTTIGSGTIIGSGAVVGGRIEPYSIVSGNPAQVRRRRFDDATIDALLDIAWWDWPIDHITANEAAICGGDIDALVKAAQGVPPAAPDRP